MVNIRILTPDIYDDYTAFLDSIPSALIYTSLQYRSFLCSILSCKTHYLVAYADSTSDIQGVLPLFSHTNSVFGTVTNSLPWYGSHGSCLLSDPNNEKVRSELLHSYLDITKDNLSSTMILSPSEQPFIQTYQQILQPSTFDQRIGQITHLPNNTFNLSDDLLSTYKQKTRNLVRKSLKQDFTLTTSDDDAAWEFLFETHVANMTAIGGTSKPLSHFEAIRNNIQQRKLFTAFKDGIPIASLLLFYYNQTVEYITPVINHEYRSLQPLSFLIWHSMLDAVRSGFSFWNWGGTWVTQSSLHHFKSGWGAIDYPYSYLINTPSESKAFFLDNQSLLRSSFPYFYTYPFISS